MYACRPFVVITTLSTGLVGVEVTSVSWLGQLTVRPFVVTTTLSTGLVGIEVTSVFWLRQLTVLTVLPKLGDRSNFNTHKTC